MKKIIFIICLLALSSAKLESPDISAVPASARNVGLGGLTTVIVDDPAAAVHNPAGLAPLKRLKFFSMSANTLQDVNYLNYGLAVPIFENSVLGFSYLSRNIDKIPLTQSGFTASTEDYANIRYTSYQESVFLMSYAYAASLWSRPLYLGTSAKFFNKSLSSYDKAAGSAFNMDLGLYAEPWRDLGLGVKIQNILQGQENRNAQGGMIWGTGEAENIAQYVTLGLVNKTLQRNLLLGLDFKKNISQDYYPTTTHFGAEWHPLDALFFRVGAGQYLLAPDVEDGGYNSLSTYYSIGLGLNLFGFRLDYAYCPDREVADLTTHYFSLSFVGPEPVEKPAPPAKAQPKTVTPDAKLLTALTVQYPAANLTTTDTTLTVKATLRNGRAYMLNGEEYTLGSDQKINKTVELSVGLNDLLLGLPGQPALYKFKILRLQKYDDIARERVKDNIVAIATLGYMSGDYPRQFNPRRTVSRQEMAAVVVRLNKYSEPILRGIVDEVDILSNQGILKGFPDGMMRPEDKLTRGQLAVVLARLLNLPLRETRPYSIVTQEHWADAAIAALENTGIYKKSEFTPRDASVTKADLADFFCRLPQVSTKINALYAYDDTAIKVSPVNNLGTQRTPATGSDQLLFEEAVRSAR